MAEPASYLAPMIDPHGAVLAASIALWIWPAFVVAAIALFRWRSLRYRGAFVVLGYLVCVGVGALIGKLGGTMFWVAAVPSNVGDRIVVALVNASITQTVVGLIVSPIPVIWLSVLLRRKDAAAI